MNQRKFIVVKFDLTMHCIKKRFADVIVDALCEWVLKRLHTLIIGVHYIDDKFMQSILKGMKGEVWYQKKFTLYW